MFRYCGFTGLTDPAGTGPCNAGYFCAEHATNPTPANDNYGNGRCPAGFFCEEG